MNTGPEASGSNKEGLAPVREPAKIPYAPGAMKRNLSAFSHTGTEAFSSLTLLGVPPREETRYNPTPALNRIVPSPRHEAPLKFPGRLQLSTGDPPDLEILYIWREAGPSKPMYSPAVVQTAVRHRPAKAL